MTTTSDFLINHAYQSVWCAPPQDRQHIVAPTRITTRRGTLGGLKLGMRYYTLPTQADFYHVFMIGDLPPLLVGMNVVVDAWVSVKAHCISTSLLVDLYTNMGIHFPTHQAYFLYTRDGNLVIAFKHIPQIVNLGDVQPFIRWRSNAYFDGNTGIPMNQGIEIEGTTITDDLNALYSFQNLWRAAKANTGYAYAFVNGLRVKDINISTVKAGDIVEYVRDASVKEVVEIPVKDLLSFDSILDNKVKYLLPRVGLGDTIDYLDDVDVYLLHYTKTAVYDGVYYHQNQNDSVRMVTHRDYSVPTAYLSGYIDGMVSWKRDDDIRVELIVRHSGYQRALVDEHHRIKELFKLPQDKRIKAMVGEEAGVSVWKAAELENSAYLKLMSATSTSITKDLVASAYGYNAVSRLISGSPVKVPVGAKWITVPFSCYEKATVYEYDSSGKLLGWFIHDTSVEYPLRNLDAKYVEFYSGEGGIGLSTAYNASEYELTPGVDYRFYVSDIWNGVAQNNWKDVTGDDTYYTVVNNVVKWHVATDTTNTAIRNSRDFLAYTLRLDYRDQLLAFSIQTREIMTGLVPVTGLMDIPPGEFDIFLNGFDLIRGVDYYVNWPEVCIVNKQHLVPGFIQRVDIRARGFCNKDLSRRTDADVGFVAYGQLSHNARFQVRDDKVTRITVGGVLYTTDEVAFSEDGQVMDGTIPNGYPYRITHPMIPMNGIVDQDTYDYMAVSESVDKEVEGYLTLQLPEPVQPLPNPIPGLYQVFSPLCAKLIYDMLDGILTIDEFKGEYSLDYLRERLRGYDWILPYDPAIIGVDENYVVIQPHPEPDVIELNVYQYRLLYRAVEALLNGKVELNRNLVIVEPGYNELSL